MKCERCGRVSGLVEISPDKISAMSMKDRFTLPVGHLCVSVRLSHAMRRLQIRTIGDLVQNWPDEFAKIKNAGRVTAEEIKELFVDCGLIDKYKEEDLRTQKEVLRSIESKLSLLLRLMMEQKGGDKQ